MDEHRPPPLTASVELHLAVEGRPQAARLARHVAAVVAAEAGWGREVADLELVVGELVANAVAHGGSPVVVHLALAGPRLVVEVRDPGRGVPAVSPPDQARQGGWGLRMVDALASSTGWYHATAQGGTSVWASLDADGGPPAGPPTGPA